jgi:hypothetical protein
MPKNLQLLLFTVFSNILHAQISISTSTTDSGQVQLTISNVSSKVITAYAWSLQEAVAQPNGRTIPVSSEHIFDAVGSHHKPVLPGENRIAGTSSDVHAKLAFKAVIFEDGSSFGSSEGTEKILRRRTDALGALVAILPVVENLSGKDFTSTASQRQLSEAREASLLTVPDERAAGVLRGESTTRYSAISKEKSNTW